MAKNKFIDISVFGDKQLQKDLNAIGIKAGKKVVRSALRKEAKVVSNNASAKAPVDTGDLRDSIKVRASTNKRRGQFGVEVAPGTRAELGIDPKDEYYYPAANEFGRNAGTGRRAVMQRTRRKARQKLAGKRTTNKIVPARPFLRPAFDERKDVALKNIMASITAEVTKAWKK